MPLLAQELEQRVVHLDCVRPQDPVWAVLDDVQARPRDELRHASAAGLDGNDLAQLARPGFRIVFYDSLEEFYLAEALEYIRAWQTSTADNPVRNRLSVWH